MDCRLVTLHHELAQLFTDAQSVVEQASFHTGGASGAGAALDKPALTVMM